MLGERGITHGLKFTSRALATQTAETQRHRWLVGTTCLREENEIQILEFDAEREAVKAVETYVHKPEIWAISPNPSNAQQFVTVYSEAGTSKASLWQATPQRSTLTEVTELKGHTGRIQAVSWHPAKEDHLVSIEEGRLRTWALRGQADMTADTASGEVFPLWTGCWDPKDVNRYATTGGNNFQLWDLRTLKKTGEVEGAHLMPVRDFDFAHRRENLAVTAGDDCRLRYWDLRALGKPLLELGGHSHWVWQARFNPTYDQLTLSGSSDAMASLWYTPNVAAGEAVASNGGRHKENPDGRAKPYDDHEDSVYGVAWSPVDPWVFASLSYDGRVVISQVPSQVKYKILI